jgi:predicted  nucleic acid-binding Zn-ribbon protein
MFQETAKLEAALQKNAAQIKSANAAKTAASLEQLDKTQKEFDALSEQLYALEKECKKTFRRLGDMKADADKNFKSGTDSAQEKVKLMAWYTEQTAKVRSDFKAQLDEMNALQAKIAPELFDAYKKRRDGKKMPALVVYDPKNGSCTACGMGIKIEMESKLKNAGDVAECPNCRRLVYLE